MSFLKPYLLLACVAFTIGFVGYWALGRISLSQAAAHEAPGAPVTTTISDPDEWNPLKLI